MVWGPTTKDAMKGMKTGSLSNGATRGGDGGSGHEYHWSMSHADVSTGDLFVTQGTDAKSLHDELLRLRPRY